MSASIILLALLLQPVPTATGPVRQYPPAPAPGKSSKSSTTNSEILATIVQSRSTNTRGYNVAIHQDGSATITMNGAGSLIHSEPPLAETLPAHTVDVTSLRTLLEKIGDVSRIPAGHCPKSVSFGTTTTIAYAGKTSGDLQCLREPSQPDESVPIATAQELTQCVQAILGKLKISDRRIAPNP